MNEEVDLSGISDADIRAYLQDMGIDLNSTITSSQVSALTASKQVAASTGQQKLFNTIDTVLKYLDKGLTIASKNGLIGKQDVASMFPSLSGLTTDTTSSAPSASSRVFNIDFTDPKTLIIVFFVVMILAYFLFFNSNKRHAKS